jgi:hypothetical protein
VAERTLLKRLARELDEARDDAARDLPGWRPQAGPPFPVSALALFAQLEEVTALWRELREAPLAERAGRYVTSTWTLKDMLGHLATWAGEFRREVETVAAGGGFDYAIPFALNVMGPNEWNERHAQAQRPVPLDAVLDEFERETRRLQDLVLALPPAALYGEAEFPLAPTGDVSQLWRGNIAMIVMGKCSHDLHHLERIREWLRRLAR